MEKLREAELEMEVSICEPEQGEVLGEDEDLKTETSSETKRSHGLKSDNLCMFAGEPCKEGQFVDIVIKDEEDRQNLNYVLKEDEIDRSHVNACKQLGKSFTFQHVARTEGRGSLTHDDGQKKEEVEKDIKQPSGGLEEAEEKTIEIFLSHVKNLEQQKDFSRTLMFEVVTRQEQFLVKGDEIQSEELICEATVETVELYNFQIDNLSINAGIISNDEVLMKCNREIELLENSEYDSMIAEEGVHYSGQEKEDIIRADGLEERLDDSLINSFVNLNQHTDV